MRKYLHYGVVAISMLFVINGCAKNESSILDKQIEKDAFCIREAERAYENLLKADNSATRESRHMYEKMAFNILKNASENKCGSAHHFLSMHYTTGIGTTKNTQKVLYENAMNKFYMDTSPEIRLQLQGTEINNIMQRGER
jgi:hypothetical protein